MKRHPQIMVALLVAALMVPVVVSARRLANARDELQATQLSAAGAVRDTQRVLTLRQKQQRIADRKRPEQDVIARVNATLTEADIPLSRFAGLRPASDSALRGSAQNGPPYRRQTVQITLRRLTIPELGAFLGAWSSTQDLWTPTQIELSHVRRRSGPVGYNATILISATYLADR